jgi:hypothetical protein
MSPEHSRAYTVGMTKLMPYKGKKDEYIQIGIEVNPHGAVHLIVSLEMPVNGTRIVKYSRAIQTAEKLLGAGIGPGGNFQSVHVSWVQGLKQLGLQLGAL